MDYSRRNFARNLQRQCIMTTTEIRSLTLELHFTNVSRIQTIGYGDTRPILTKGTDEERKVNQRIEFVVLSL